MPEALVHQLMCCYWREHGLEVESADTAMRGDEDVMAKVAAIRARKKPQFKF